ncbi:hypothetical protein VIN13_1365 [Saccharomyces cerevisiae Vin13]|nr:hypothetical protein VIN13_1365 [Saccharomyces cerevisiae Vin13]
MEDSLPLVNVLIFCLLLIMQTLFLRIELRFSTHSSLFKRKVQFAPRSLIKSEVPNTASMDLIECKRNVFLWGGASYRLERNRSATFSTHNRNRALTLINAISGVKTAYKVYMAYRSPTAFSFAEGQLRYDSVMLCWKVAPNPIHTLYGVKKSTPIRGVEPRSPR